MDILHVDRLSQKWLTRLLGTLLSVAVAIIALTTAFFWWSLHHVDVTAAKSNSYATSPTQVTTVGGVPDSNVLVQQQEAAARAAEQVPVSTVAQAVVTSRPSYVSEVEWQALQSVAARSPDRDHELARLVGHLLFSKRLEQWQSQGRTGEAQKRQALAMQLLQALSGQVQDHGVGIDEARKLMPDLVKDAEVDPGRRESLARDVGQRMGSVEGKGDQAL